MFGFFKKAFKILLVNTFFKGDTLGFFRGGIDGHKLMTIDPTSGTSQVSVALHWL